MTVTIDLPGDALARLQAVVKRRGVGIDVVVAKMAEALPTGPIPRRSLSLIGLA